MQSRNERETIEIRAILLILTLTQTQPTHTHAQLQPLVVVSGGGHSLDAIT